MCKELLSENDSWVAIVTFKIPNRIGELNSEIEGLRYDNDMM